MPDTVIEKTGIGHWRKKTERILSDSNANLVHKVFYFWQIIRKRIFSYWFARRKKKKKKKKTCWLTNGLFGRRRMEGKKIETNVWKDGRIKSVSKTIQQSARKDSKKKKVSIYIQ